MDSLELNRHEWRGSEDAAFVEEQLLVVVDKEDREIGFLDRDSAHAGRGVLHRAFSLFVFNAQGELLIQQRAPRKRLWPGYWSNSCCSHPRRGETFENAIRRCLGKELGMQCSLEFLFKFEYYAQFDADGAEHELCSVYGGRGTALPTVNLNEISALRYVSPDALDAEMGTRPETFTPWFKIEWKRVRGEHAHLFVPLSVTLTDPAKKS